MAWKTFWLLGELAGQPSRTISGRDFRTFSTRIDASGASGTGRGFPCSCLARGCSAKLKPGTFARVQISTDRVERAITIPVAAVQSRYGTNRVFVVKDGQLAGREIVLGDRLGDRVEVSQGLDAGTLIVASDVEQLADGMKVTTR